MRISLWRSLAVVAVCVYLPHSWLFWIDYPWNDYRWYWIKMLPVLPGIAPAAVLFQILQTLLSVDASARSQRSLMVIAGLFTLALLASLTVLGMKGPRRLGIAMAIALLISVPCAFTAYALFRA